MLFSARKSFFRGTLNSYRNLSQIFKPQEGANIRIDGKEYTPDTYTNVTPKILQLLERKLHLQEKHPVNLFKERIVNHFHKNFVNRRGNAEFSILDRLSPVVSLSQNFDSLLVPQDHPSRNFTDSYYINREFMLRAHTSAHQHDLIQSGLDSFLVIGDVYRRDAIDSRHYPVFHQVEGVRLFAKDQLFKENADKLDLFEKPDGKNVDNKQQIHSIETVKLLEFDLKKTLENMVKDIFEESLETRWVDTFFPFTHPSFELEIKLNDIWIEVLGCGIMRQEILDGCGVDKKVGWAFGIGLERIAMLYYGIDDIRAFWSQDPAFKAQFNFTDPYKRIKFKEISKHAPCSADVSFWLSESFNENDFYDLVRSIGGDLVQEVTQIDVFTNKKTAKTSHCYRIVYRHMDKTLTQEEVNLVHEEIRNAAADRLRVELRVLS